MSLIRYQNTKWTCKIELLYYTNKAYFCNWYNIHQNLQNTIQWIKHSQFIVWESNFKWQSVEAIATNTQANATNTCWRGTTNLSDLPCPVPRGRIFGIQGRIGWSGGLAGWPPLYEPGRGAQERNQWTRSTRPTKGRFACQVINLIWILFF